MKILLLLVGVAAFMLAFACRQQKPVVIDYVKYQSDAQVPRVSVEDAKKEFDAGNAVFVDSRGEGAWKAERLPGALDIAFGSPVEKFSQLPKGKNIIVYCS